MREINLTIVTALKFLELMFIFSIGIAIIVNSFSFMDEKDKFDGKYKEVCRDD